MSTMSAPAPSAPPTTTGGVGEALLSLAAFVQTPAHADRVKALQRAELAANMAAEHLAALKTEVADKQLALDKAASEFKQAKADFEASSEKTRAALTERETSVQKAEADLAARKRQFDADHAFQIGDYTKQINALAIKQLNIEQRERELTSREAALAQREANVADTETELQQAISKRRR